MQNMPRLPKNIQDEQEASQNAIEQHEAQAA
jgi:hypothetical protein